jgi:hypothetical protein
MLQNGHHCKNAAVTHTCKKKKKIIFQFFSNFQWFLFSGKKISQEIFLGVSIIEYLRPNWSPQVVDKEAICQPQMEVICRAGETAH